MTILSAQTIRRLGLIEPFADRTELAGITYGLSAAGYDVRIAQNVSLNRGDFVLASTVERFVMPDDVVGIVCDKSSWARRGLAVQNTVIEPGWRGYLTLELSVHGHNYLNVAAGMGIAQVVFHRLDAPTESPYAGKYQDQLPGPQGAR